MSTTRGAHQAAQPTLVNLFGQPDGTMHQAVPCSAYLGGVHTEVRLAAHDDDGRSRKSGESEGIRTPDPLLPKRSISDYRHLPSSALPYLISLI
jgi:hypothetical protein